MNNEKKSFNVFSFCVGIFVALICITIFLFGHNMVKETIVCAILMMLAWVFTSLAKWDDLNNRGRLFYIAITVVVAFFEGFICLHLI